MKFIVDAEAKGTLTQLCDIALKQGGLQSMQAIQTVLSSIEDYNEEAEKQKGFGIPVQDSEKAV